MEPDSSVAKDKSGSTSVLKSLESDAVYDSNMARSAELQAQWNALRDEMDKLVKEIANAPAPTEEQLIRKDKISAHMIVIKDEMTNVLAKAQEKLPLEAENCNGDREGEAPVCSKTGKHRIERTYDSSDSDGPPVSRPPIDQQLEEFVNSISPCSATSATDREVPSSRVRKEGTVLTALGTKLRSTLRPATSFRGMTVNSVSEDPENFKLEESRLERELRSLRKEPKLDDAGQKRVAEITVRLKEIADLSLDSGMPTSLPENKPMSSPAPKGPQQTLKSMARAFVATATSPRRRDKPSFGGAPASTAGPSEATSAMEMLPKEGENENEERANSKESGEPLTKKKSGNMVTKRWGKFTSGLEKKLTTLSKNVNRAASGGAGSGGGSSSQNNSPASVAAAAAATASGSGANEFSEMKQRMTQRGEKLDGLGKEAEGMREGATDMLAAARALRKKTEKKGLFS